MSDYDAIVVGSGPNGLTAAVTLARAGRSVLVLEAKDTIGGGTKTQEVTLPGFHHDICSAIHPMGVVSPVFRALGLERHGVEFIYAPLELAHPFDDGSAAVLSRSMHESIATLGIDGEAWRKLMDPFVRRLDTLMSETLRPIRIPRHPLLMLRFGLHALRSCDSLVRARFVGDHARAIFAGCAAHSILPLDAVGTASFGLMLAIVAHGAGWPLVRGGSRRITDALASLLEDLGGRIELGRPVRTLSDVPPSRALLLDLTPRQVASVVGDALPPSYRRKLESFRYGPGSFKLDWALAGPIPWRAPECHRAATVHLGSGYAEIADAESRVARGEHPDIPFVLVAQQSQFDATRAPEGRQTGWAYCHVPPGSTVDMTDRIEAQVERFAPGFRDLILARHVMNSADLEAHNPNMIGGDIGGGANDLPQFIFRPVVRLNPYSTPDRRIFICSSSTPPGGGVHGMCGFWAANSAM